MHTTAQNSEDMRFMMETYGFTAEELEGMNLARFIQDFELRTRDYTAREVRDILIAQGSAYADDGTAAVFALFSEKGRELRDGDEVDRIGLYLNEGTLVQKLVFDLKDNVYYLNTAEPHTLTAEQSKQLRGLPKKYKISTWEQHTSGKEEPSTGSFGWKLTLKLSNGEYCTYDGFTGDMSHLPENFNELLREFQNVLRMAD